MRNLTLIIVCALFCISASVVSSNVFTPAKPKQFFVKEYRSSNKAILESKALFLNGWQSIKVSVSSTFDNSGYTNELIVVTAEKY